jgi:hypothetical protein
MTIAEKLLRAKTDIDEVHAAGYNKGNADGQATGYTNGYNQCTVDMQDDLQAKYDEGYSAGETAGMDSVKIGEAKSSADLTSVGAIVFVPAGYYAGNASKTIPSADRAIPTINVTTSGYITASVTHSKSGYIEVGTEKATKQLPVVSAKTITPSTAAQTAIAAGTYAEGDVIVSGDTDLIGSNIIKGKTIFGIAGTARTYSEAMTAYFPILMQGIVTPKDAKSALGDTFSSSYSESDYNDTLGNFVGLYFDDLISISIDATSEEFEMEIFNNTNLSVRFLIDVYTVTDAQDALWVNIAPNEAGYVYCEAALRDAEDWSYKIVGMRFYD